MKANRQRRKISRQLANPLDVHSIKPTSLRDLGSDYVPAFVTFIDVLGFKRKVETQCAAEINAALDGVAQFATLGQRRNDVYAQEKHLPMVLQFSDSIVRVQPVVSIDDNLHALNLFHGEITSLLLAQGNLACNGVFLRGGMTFGQVCVHKDRIFGPAFVSAYQIESQLALYPRIVVDEHLLNHSPSNPLTETVDFHTWSSASSQLQEYLFQADDGLYSLDYLPHLMDAERSDSAITAGTVVSAHKTRLDCELSKPESKVPAVRSKLNWLASYHNHVVRRFSRKLGDDLYVDLR